MDPEVEARAEVRDGMRITWHQPIPMDDGIVLRADVFRPIQDGRYPVILTYGIYAKGLAYQDGYPKQWNKMAADHPEILEGSRTSARTGRSRIPSDGSRMAMPSSVSTRAAPGGLRASWILAVRARSSTCSTVSAPAMVASPFCCSRSSLTKVRHE